MPSIFKLYIKPHFLPHLLEIKKAYGKITLFDNGGDISKEWYIHYRYRHPETGLLTRQSNVYGNINSFHTLKDRNKAAKIIIDALKEMLEGGFNPYDAPKDVVELDSSVTAVKTIVQAIEFGLRMAKSQYADSTYNDFSSRLKQFKAWLLKYDKGHTLIKEFTATPIVDYLNEVLERTSPRNRNNTRLTISSLYKLLKQNHIVKVNIVEDIASLASKSTKNKTYTTEQQEELLELMDRKDPILGLFIAVLSMNVLRPVEVCRLRVEDINLKDKTLTVRTKTDTNKTKLIPELLIQLLPDLRVHNQKDLLFTPTGPGQWEATEINRRNHFGKRFKKIKKELDLGKEYGMYSWRHTYITKMYRELRKDFPPFEAKSRLMLITGHSTMDALNMYLRDIDAELPEDYSHLLHDGVKSKNGK